MVSLPIKLFEYMAAGPPVTSRTSLSGARSWRPRTADCWSTRSTSTRSWRPCSGWRTIPRGRGHGQAGKTGDRRSIQLERARRRPPCRLLPRPVGSWRGFVNGTMPARVMEPSIIAKSLRSPRRIARPDLGSQSTTCLPPRPEPPACPHSGFPYNDHPFHHRSSARRFADPIEGTRLPGARLRRSGSPLCPGWAGRRGRSEHRLSNCRHGSAAAPPSSHDRLGAGGCSAPWPRPAPWRHFHDPELLPWAILLRLSGIKVVYDVHEDVPRQVKHNPGLPAWAQRVLPPFVSLVEWIGARCSTAFVAATHDDRGTISSRRRPSWSATSRCWKSCMRRPDADARSAAGVRLCRVHLRGSQHLCNDRGGCPLAPSTPASPSRNVRHRGNGAKGEGDAPMVARCFSRAGFHGKALRGFGRGAPGWSS